MEILSFVQPATSDWLVNIISWLVKTTSSIALGVVLFTVILKLITLPFDFFSRASMRKNSIKMEEMRGDLEKLQKQYANDKNLYNQKMMALYKKNGYSMWGACLPTIITLVIFIVAINAFTSYSRFQNNKYFYEMAIAYDSVISEELKEDDYITVNSKGEIVLTDAFINEIIANKDTAIGTETAFSADGSIKLVNEELINGYETDGDSTTPITKQTLKFRFVNGNGFVQYNNSIEITVANGDPSVSENCSLGGVGKPTFSVIKENIGDDLFFKNTRDGVAVYFNDDYVTSKLDAESGETLNDETRAKYAAEFIKEVQQYKAAEAFRSNDAKMLWVKNIWVTDSPFKHPVTADYSEYNKNNAASINKDTYDQLVAKLSPEKTEPNGYLILVVLTAGVSLLMQFVTGKSQKAQMELQTVDGQGAQTQKMMMWLMPIMMAVFAFIYTAAFSIYIILSSAISIGTTFIINLIVDKKYKKGKAADEKVRGRIYVPEVKEEKKPEKKKKPTEEEKDGFLSGKADKKHFRGRIKE